MSVELQRQIRDILDRLERWEKTDISNGRSPPYTQRALNSFPLASSGTSHGEFPQFGSSTKLLVFRVSIFVVTTNNGTNFWTITLRDDAASVLATVDTSAASANTWTRLATTSLVQPGSTNTIMTVRPTATLSPGAIFVVPEILVLP